MTLSRRDFLRRSSLAIAGGLIVGDAALELLDRLTHKKVWSLGGLPREAMATNTVRYNRIVVECLSSGPRCTMQGSLDGQRWFPINSPVAAMVREGTMRFTPDVLWGRADFFTHSGDPRRGA